MNRAPLPKGVYCITAEQFSKGRSNVEVAKEMAAGGAAVLQYREKHGKKSPGAMYEECLAIRCITREAGMLFIVNDYPELAMLADADGVHVGQDDLPVAAVRELVGDKIIGLSTHGPEQARQAITDGADYIGVGPLFATRTKEDVCDPVGLPYLDFTVQEIPLPGVAIGGIKLNNIHQVLERGARSVALVTEIVGATEIAATVRQIRELVLSD